MLTATDIAFGVILPAIVTFLVLALAGRWWRGRESPPLPGWAWPLALGLGFLAGHAALVVIQPSLVGAPLGELLKDYLLPMLVENRAGWIVLLLAAVGMTEGWLARRDWLRWLLRLAVTAFAFYLLTQPDFRHAQQLHEVAHAWASVVVLTLGMLILWGLASEAAYADGDDPAVTIRLDGALLAACVGAAAVLIMLSDSAKIGQFTGALAVTQATLWGAHLFIHRQASPVAAAGPLVVATLWLAVAAHLYAGLPGLTAIAIALSLAFAASPALTRRLASGYAQQALRLGLILLLLAGPLTAAGLQFIHDYHENASGYGNPW